MTLCSPFVFVTVFVLLLHYTVDFTLIPTVRLLYCENGPADNVNCRLEVPSTPESFLAYTSQNIKQNNLFILIQKLKHHI